MLLLRPFLLKTKNVVSRAAFSTESILRTFLVCLFASAIPYSLYRGMSWVLSKANEDPALSILPPSLLLGMIFGFLQVMLIIPAIFLTLGSYFLAEAVDYGKADICFHGHAHAGVERGETPGGCPVRNVAQPVIRHAFNIYTLE